MQYIWHWILNNIYMCKTMIISVGNISVQYNIYITSYNESNDSTPVYDLVAKDGMIMVQVGCIGLGYTLLSRYRLGFLSM